jgi:hypothetical protein
MGSPPPDAPAAGIFHLVLTRYDPLNTGQLQILASRKTCCPWTIPGGEVKAGERIAVSARNDVEGCIANARVGEGSRLGEILRQLLGNDGAAGYHMKTDCKDGGVLAMEGKFGNTAAAGTIAVNKIVRKFGSLASIGGPVKTSACLPKEVSAAPCRDEAPEVAHSMHFHCDAELGALIRPTCDSDGNVMQWLPIGQDDTSNELILRSDHRAIAAQVLERLKDGRKTKGSFESVAKLREWLVQNSVSAEKLSTWGSSKGTKSLEKLWGELAGEETLLFLANGTAFRVVHVAKGKIFHVASGVAGASVASSRSSTCSSTCSSASAKRSSVIDQEKYLIEAKQTLPGGEEVARRLFLSEKMKKDETFEQVRCAHVEVYVWQ